MAEISSVGIGMRNVHIHRFAGDVIDSQRSSETSVTGHGNGQISSYTSHYNQIFLRATDGQEKSVEVASSGVSVRPGNKVTVLWGIVGNDEKGAYTTVHNHDTNQTGHIAKGINDTAGPPFYNMMIILFVIIGVISVFSLFGGGFGSILFIAATAFFFYWLTQRRRKLRSAMEAAILK